MTRAAKAALVCALFLTAILGPVSVRGQDRTADAGVVKIEVITLDAVRRIGSGFIVALDDDRAYVVTAAHVVLGSRETNLRFSTQPRAQPVAATVIHAQHQDTLGLALLSIPAAAVRAAGAGPLPLSPEPAPVKGQDLILIGHPRTAVDWSWLHGTVAGREGESLKVQAIVDEGSSGGPVLKDEEVVGIVMAELSGIVDVKLVVNIRNYLDGLDVTPGDHAGLPAKSQPPTAPVTTPAPARLTVHSNVAGSSVWIDDERRGITRLDVVLRPGAHTVRVESGGYEPFTTRFDLRPGEPHTVNAELKMAQPEPPGTFHDCADCPEMVVIPAGAFALGSPDGEQGRSNDEGPVHTVRISAPFAMGRREVTVREFRAFVDASHYRTQAEQEGCFSSKTDSWQTDPQRTWRSPGYPQSDDHPVVCVTWMDARAYLDWLAKKTGHGYRLPSEAQWEYAARAGTTTARFWGQSPDLACSYANVADKKAKEQFPRWAVHDCHDGFAYTAPAGAFKPNGFGLNDMLGNAGEWIDDCRNENYRFAPSDGTAWITGDCRLRGFRGGAWDLQPDNVRAAYRSMYDAKRGNDRVGFRPLRSLISPVPLHLLNSSGGE